MPLLGISVLMLSALYKVRSREKLLLGTVLDNIVSCVLQQFIPDNGRGAFSVCPRFYLKAKGIILPNMISQLSDHLKPRWFFN